MSINLYFSKLHTIIMIIITVYYFYFSILSILRTEADVLPESVIPTVRSLFSTSATV